MMRDVMLDLETLGTSPGCIVLSIGAVFFDPYRDKFGESFYTEINKLSSLTYELKVDPKTEAWWQEQSAEARVILTLVEQDEAPTLPTALVDFHNFLGGEKAKEVRVWGNGAAFDNEVLKAAFRAAAMEVPWSFRNDRCYRTLKGLVPELDAVRIGTFHNAVDDALTQASHACEIFKRLGLSVA